MCNLIHVVSFGIGIGNPASLGPVLQRGAIDTGDLADLRQHHTVTNKENLAQEGLSGQAANICLPQFGSGNGIVNQLKIHNNSPCCFSFNQPQRRTISRRACYIKHIIYDNQAIVKYGIFKKL
jgi:hypothetical protein